MHLCTLQQTEDVESKWKRSMQIWERSPRTIKRFRSAFEIEKERRKHATTHPRIIHPCSKFRTYYEIWMILLIFATVTYFPMFTSFPTRSNNEKSHADFFVFVVFSMLNITDIGINFVTGYVEGADEIICDPRRIAKRYLYSKWLVLDFLMFVIGPTTEFVMRFITPDREFSLTEPCILAVFKLGRLFKFIRRLCQFARTSEGCTSLCECLLLIFMMFHWTTCFQCLVPKFRWLYGGDFPRVNKNSWLYHSDVTLHTPLLNIYFKSIYRATSHLLCIQTKGGRRFELPWEESALESILFIFGKLSVSWVTVIILQMFLSTGRKERQYQETMNELAEYMSMKKLPSAMQQRVIRFYEYKYNRTVFRDNEIFEALSGMLVNQVRFYKIEKLLETVSIFKDLDKRTLECISKHLKSEVFLENDIILRAGEVGDCMYFILNGTVAAFTSTGEEVCHLEDGAYFGEISLLLKNVLRPGTVVAIERCTLYRLDKKALKLCIKDQAVFDNLEKMGRERLARLEERMANTMIGAIEEKHI